MKEGEVDKPERKSPGSVIYTNLRQIYEDEYPGKFDDTVARRLIELYTVEGDVVMDPMSGSGIIPIEAVKMKRHAVAIDINPECRSLMLKKYSKVLEDFKQHGNLEVKIGEASKVMAPMCDNFIDFVMTSPSFGISVDAKHDGYSDIPEDMANSKTYEQWRERLRPVLREIFRVLKPGKLAAIETRPRAKKNKSYPLWFWITGDMLSEGFEYFCDYIEAPVPPFMLYTSGDEDSRMPMPWHSFILMFRKPEQETLGIGHKKEIECNEFLCLPEKNPSHYIVL